MSDSPQNIILVSADGPRADFLSCYGYYRELPVFGDHGGNEGIERWLSTLGDKE